MPHKTKHISLTRFLIEEERAGRVNADLRLLIEVVARACKSISIAVGKGALGGVLGDAGTDGEASINVQGEAQKKLDVLSNEILLEANAWGGHLAACASEEMEDPQPIPDKYPRGKDFNMRWVASMVADVHRILTRGGIFSYPLDSKCAAKGGKLRLMYEANPMSLLVEQAGGAASTGRQRMLDVQPTGLHMRVPVFLGSKSEVQAAVRYHAEHDAAG